MAYTLDKIDRHILEYLQCDAKMTIKQMAEKLHLSTTPIFDRIKKMELAGVIKSYVAMVDRKQLGLNLIVFINISIKEHGKDAINQFIKEVVKFEEVLECHHISGDSDILVKLLVEDMSRYNTFILDKLAVIPNIGKVESRFSLSERKYTSQLKLPRSDA